jgi:arylsulfatase A-like enzyme
MDDELNPILWSQMENYAGFLEFTDHHVGRVVDAIPELGLLDNTLIYYIIGDNAASAEGTLTGTFNAMIGVNGGDDLQTAQFMREYIDKIGSPESLPALRSRLGPCPVYAVPMDQAGRLAWGWHSQRDDRPLAPADQCPWRDPQPIPPRDRRCADDP